MAGRPPSIAGTRRINAAMAMLAVAFVVAAISVVAKADTDVDPSEDFGGYVEELERRQRDEEAYQAKLAAHEEWLQKTWGGATVRMTLGLVNHLRPFLEAVEGAISETNDGGERSPTQVMAYLGIRMLYILVALAIFWIGTKIIDLMIGGDIEMVEEVVIVHEHETEEEAAKARAAMKRGKRRKEKSS